MRLRLERYFSHDVRSISQNVASLNISSWHDELVIWTLNRQAKQIFMYKEVLCLEECNDIFRGIRGMRNLSKNNLATNKETVG